MTTIDISSRFILSSDSISDKDFIAGSNIYICIHSLDEFIAGEKRAQGYWFKNTKWGTDSKKGSKRAIISGQFFDIFSPENPRLATLKWTSKGIHNGIFCLPGGRSHAEESIYQSGRRKMLEDTNFDLDDLRKKGAIIYAKRFPTGEDYDYHSKYFYALYVYIDFGSLKHNDPLLSILDFDDTEGKYNQTYFSFFLSLFLYYFYKV